MGSDDDVVLTREEYDELIGRVSKLEALEAAGVDNWEGFDDAIYLLNTEERDDLIYENL